MGESYDIQSSKQAGDWRSFTVSYEDFLVHYTDVEGQSSGGHVVRGFSGERL
jgi:hypothetical protein